MTEKQTKPKLIPVSVLKRDGDVVLVEWVRDGEAFRGYLPQAMLGDSGVAEDELEAAMPYGIPWADVLTINASVSDLNKRLKNAGLWTAADVQNNPRVVIGAIQAAFDVDLTKVLIAARQFEEKGAKK
jgi:hypothetical protein